MSDDTIRLAKDSSSFRGSEGPERMTVIVQRVKMQSFAEDEDLPFDEMRQTIGTADVPASREPLQVVKDVCAQSNTDYNPRWDYELHKVEATISLSDLGLALSTSEAESGGDVA